MDPLDAAANFLRDSDLGYKQAKAEYEGIREVRYTDLNSHVIETAKRSSVIANTVRYVDSIARGAAACLAEDTFFIDYNLRTNLLGTIYYGETHCLDLSFRVNWVVRKVVASFYTGTSTTRDVNVPDDLRRVLWEGKVRDLAKFAEMTGLDERHVGPREGNTLVSLFQCSSVVQCKLTRLVKGWLIYLDHLESGGTKTYARAELPTIDYNVKELLKTMHFSNTAYVYTTREWDSAYNLILYAMCQQYPSPLFGGAEHVKIPADGDAIYLVGYSPMKRYENVVVSPELVMETMIEYSDQFGVGEDLESAMIIACSLRQNRYLEKVDLPAVLSYCDLIYPALSDPEAGGRGVREQPILSKEAAVMLGRFHQMACLLLFKDLDTSFRNYADPNGAMMYFLGMYQFRLIMEDQMSGGLLPMSNALIWLRFLDEESMARLRKYSVFEGFWLVKEKPVKVLKDGIIKCLKRRVTKHNGSIRIRLPGVYFDDNFDVLMEEVILGGGDPQLKCSDGAFNVGFSCIRKVERSGHRRILSSAHEGTSSSNIG